MNLTRRQILKALGFATAATVSGFASQLVTAERVVLNVLDFGADPTGQTDSTEAIQRAVDAAERIGADVYIPDGNYFVPNPYGELIHGKFHPKLGGLPLPS